MSLLDLLGNFYNLVYVLGLLVKNILWLRLVILFAAILEIVYNFLCPEIQWPDIYWTAGYILVNVYELFFLVRERINLRFTEKEKIVHLLSFAPMNDVNYKKVLNISKWQKADPETILVEEGVILDKLILIFSGVAKVEINDQIVAYIGDGNFVGEMSYITNNMTNAKVTSITEIEYLTWNRTDLNKLISSSNEIDESLKTIFNLDLVSKLTKKDIKQNP